MYSEPLLFQARVRRGVAKTECIRYDVAGVELLLLVGGSQLLGVWRKRMCEMRESKHK